jgi:hypothetical protein
MFRPANAHETARTAGLWVMQFAATDAVEQHKILALLITVQTDSTVSCVRLAVQGFCVTGRHTRYNLSVNITSITYQISNLAAARELFIDFG